MILTTVSSEAWAKLRVWASVAGRGRLLLLGSVAHASLKTAVQLWVPYLNTKGCKNVVRTFGTGDKIGVVAISQHGAHSLLSLPQTCWHFLPQSAHVVVPPSKDLVQEVVFAE